MRESYQGITSPVDRSEDYFDPGAKYHIPANTPYTRYYLARIMQYQFHEALCNAMNFDGPLMNVLFMEIEKLVKKLSLLWQWGRAFHGKMLLRI